MLTCIVCHTESVNAVFDISQGTQTGHKPAIAETTLLYVTGIDFSHECRLLINFMDSLDGLGHRGAGAEES